MESPRPRPLPRWSSPEAFQNGSKRWGRASEEMPGPLSVTSSITPGSARRSRTITVDEGGEYFRALESRFHITCVSRPESP